MDNTISIRQAGAVYAAQISRLISRLMQNDWSAVYKPQTVASYKRMFSPEYFTQALNTDCVALGAFHNSELIGIYVLKKDFGGVGFVDWLGVDQRYRRQGVATELLNAGDALAVSVKLHFLYLYTENPENIVFYEKRGFEKVGQLKNFWYGENEYLMVKQLQPEPFPEVFSD